MLINCPKYANPNKDKQPAYFLTLKTVDAIEEIQDRIKTNTIKRTNTSGVNSIAPLNIKFIRLSIDYLFLSVENRFTTTVIFFSAHASNIKNKSRATVLLMAVISVLIVSSVSV